MKIGTLTLHAVNNYGAVLQAYALKETLKSMGHDTQIINYKQPNLKNQKVLVFNTQNIKSFMKSIVYNIGDAANRKIKANKFDYFRDKYMDITEEYVSSLQIRGKDAYIVGSDVVWSRLNTHFDKTYFLDFCKSGEKKISYAASIGKVNLSVQELNHLRDNINTIDCISVREESAANILKPFTNKKITQVLDPTLLADSQIWANMIDPKKTSKPYLLIYRATGKKNVFQVADYVAKKLNLGVRYINNSIKRVPYHFKKVKRVGPIEFLTLYKNAAFIVTNSFHGTAFSIIFRKNFITVPTDKSGTRMINLLALLKMQDRMVRDPSEIGSSYSYEVDYTTPVEILNREREKSLAFLRNAIES